MLWWLWLLVALAAIVTEVAVSGLIFGGVAGAALVAAVVSAFISGILPGAIVFAGATILYLVTLRPTVLRLMMPESQRRLGSPGSPAARWVGGPWLLRRSVRVEAICG